jgi:4-alpha-glucanotransferase
MVFPRFTHPITGVVVPVSALRSKESAGIGEFPDLVLLARWAADIGIKLIQILPVNDTGYERSPYSALSAFALHPIYARLNLFPEATDGPDAISAEIEKLRRAHRQEPKIDFDAVLSSKMMILRKMWESASSSSRKEAARWADDNPWVISYAVFSLLKEENGLKSWIDWEKHRNPDSKDLKKLWKKRKQEAEFWVWLQWRLENQFREVSRQLEELGVALKGDIPILITDDSADLWAERRNFNLKMRGRCTSRCRFSRRTELGLPHLQLDLSGRDGLSVVAGETRSGRKILSRLPDRSCLGFLPYLGGSRKRYSGPWRLLRTFRSHHRCGSQRFGLR